jgi:Icc protein
MSSWLVEAGAIAVRPRHQVELFAIEDHSVQVVWHSLPAHIVAFEAGGIVAEVAATPTAFVYRKRHLPVPLATHGGGIGGPGSVVISGLEAATDYELTVSGAGLSRRRVARFRTLAPPPGPLLSRLATINDLHIGEPSFGARRTMIEAGPSDDSWEPYPLRCARAAIAEAVAWGADLLVVKGDLTSKAQENEFDDVGRLLDNCPIPVEVIYGNHEYMSAFDGRPVLRRHNINIYEEPTARDLPGLRVVLGHSARAHHHNGHIGQDQTRALAELVEGAAGGAMVAIHHQPNRYPFPTVYPSGIPSVQARSMLSVLAEANPATVVVTGHTHRNRRHLWTPVPVMEIGSTKDYPGQWAGYAIHEGGIRQVIRRTAAPEVLSWTESTYWALGGAWGRWSPGLLESRCFSHTWPERSHRPTVGLNAR